MQLQCSHNTNLTLSKLSRVHIQLWLPTKFSQVRLTTVVYRSDTFFQNGLSPNLLRLAPIVGIRAEDVSTPSSNITKDASITFKDSRADSSAKLMVWENKRGRSGWKEHSKCAPPDTLPINLISCSLMNVDSGGRMFYFTLAIHKPTQVHLAPQYMKPVLYIAAGISCLFLVCTLLVYFCVRKLRANRSDSVILMNLCIALVASEVVFGWGIHRTDDVLLCKGVAVALHYFLQRKIS